MTEKSIDAFKFTRIDNNENNDLGVSFFMSESNLSTAVRV